MQQGDTMIDQHTTANGAKHIPWDTIPEEELTPLLHRQFVVGKDVMFARVLLKKGCIVPEHHHVNEQITFVWKIFYQCFAYFYR